MHATGLSSVFPQKLATVDPRPALLCGPLRVSLDCTSWSEVWASLPMAEPPELLLCVQGGGQVCVWVRGFTILPGPRDQV